MNITQEKTDDQNAVIKVVLDRDDYAQRFDNSLKDYAKSMNMPGFRPGKVPVGLVKSKYGKALLVEELDHLVSDKLNGYIKDQDLKLIGGVIAMGEQPVHGNFDNPDSFEFHFEVGLKPELDVALTQADKLTYYTVEIDEAEVEEEMRNVARRYGKLKDAETADEKDAMLMGNLVELDGNGEILPGGKMKSNIIISMESADPDVKKDLAGKKVGDAVTVDPRKVIKDKNDLAALLETTPEEAEAMDTRFNFTINSVKIMEPAEMDEELFDKIFGDDVVKTEAEFREKLTEAMNNRYKSDSDNLFRRDLSHHLIEKYNPTLPDEFLKRWLENNKDFEGDVEAEYPEYRRSTQWQLIVNHLIDTKKISVESDEILQKTMDIIRDQYAQYGIPDPDPGQLEASARQALENREQLEEVSNRLINDKLIAYARENAKVEEKRVKMDKFVELASADPAQAVQA